MKKPAVTLYIDTSSQHKILVAIEKDDSRFEEKSSAKRANAQLVLPHIEKLLKEQGLDVSSLTSIQVHTGPGSFTGLRIGIAVANMLGTLLSIPVNGELSSVTPAPVYEASRFDPT